MNWVDETLLCGFSGVSSLVSGKEEEEVEGGCLFRFYRGWGMIVDEEEEEEEVGGGDRGRYI